MKIYKGNNLTSNIFAAGIILLLIVLLSYFGPSITGLQTFTCGAEEVSSGQAGEVRKVIQTGGEENPANCAPSACSSGFYDIGIATDKYYQLIYGPSSNWRYAYQRICVKDANAGEIIQCSSSAKNTPCTPADCSSGKISIANVWDVRNFNYTDGTWDYKGYRVCASGIGLSGGSTQEAEQQSPQSFPDPPPCAQDQQSAGIFKELHHHEPDYYRSFRICVKYATIYTVSSTTTSTTAPPSAVPIASTSSSATSTTSTPTSSSATSTTISNATTESPSTTTTISGGTTTATPTTTTISGRTTTTTTTNQAIANDTQPSELITKAETKISESFAEQNTTAVEQAKSLLAQAKLLEADRKYEEATQKAREAISILDAAKEQQEKTSTNLLISNAVLILAAIIIIAAIYQNRKQKQAVSK